MNYLVEMKNISKSFFGVQVLNNVNLILKAGTVHVLCGENGAGKSVLMKILAGIHEPDSGEIFIENNKVQFHKPAEAINHGVTMIYQELSPIYGMKVSENIFLGREPGKVGLLNHKKLDSMADELLKELNCNFNGRTIMNCLKVADVQLVEIAKAISYNSKIIIMDEPTSALTERETENLFKIIDKLKKQGKGIIYISHKMDEVKRISDEVTVLRDGEFIGNWKKDDIDIQKIIFSMVGRKLDTVFPKKQCKIEENIFYVNNLQKKDRFFNINFNVKRGEILGIVGLMGAGRTEVMESLFGITKPDSGEIYYKDKLVNFSHPSQAIRQGIAFITEDRKKYGLFLLLSVVQNITMASLKMISKLGIINIKKEKKISEYIYLQLRIKSKDMKQRLKSLSGGNQQKVVLAKWLIRNPELLIMDEPTRGIDVGAKREIYKIMNEFCEKGKSIIFVSSELQEIIGMSDRIVVFSNKTVAGELNKKDFDQMKILRLAMSNL